MGTSRQTFPPMLEAYDKPERLLLHLAKACSGLVKQNLEKVEQTGKRRKWQMAQGSPAGSAFRTYREIGKKDGENESKGKNRKNIPRYTKDIVYYTSLW